MFVYDITSKESFKQIKYWINNFKKFSSVGNIYDSEEKRVVPKRMLDEFCSKNNIIGIEVNSKLGTNVSKSLKY